MYYIVERGKKVVSLEHQQPQTKDKVLWIGTSRREWMEKAETFKKGN